MGAPRNPMANATRVSLFMLLRVRIRALFDGSHYAQQAHGLSIFQAQSKSAGRRLRRLIAGEQRHPSPNRLSLVTHGRSPSANAIDLRNEGQEHSQSAFEVAHLAAGGRFRYFLLECRQIFIFSASWISSSRKSGWAMLIIISARFQVDLARTCTAPYSVTR